MNMASNTLIKKLTGFNSKKKDIVPRSKYSSGKKSLEKAIKNVESITIIPLISGNIIPITEPNQHIDIRSNRIEMLNMNVLMMKNMLTKSFIKA